MSGTIKFKHKGSFKNSETFLNRISNRSYLDPLSRLGQEGVDALSIATPKKSGTTASCWRYSIDRSKDGVTISWYNTNVVDGVNIAAILQYGHGTGGGAYVKGIDYINPAIRPVFDKIIGETWKEVTST